ncbi:MAG: hypothetical protein M3044_13400 [Thermoproteota archaeon]|nr:hypothetical protein [Thermoproteota archaeon]
MKTLTGQACIQEPSAIQEPQSTATTIVACTPNGTSSSPLAAYAASTSSFSEASESLPGHQTK